MFIPNSQNPETIQISFSRWIKKLVCLNHGILNNKKEQTIDTATTWIDLHRIMWCEKAKHKGYILCESTYIIFLKWENSNNWEQISGSWGLRRRWGQARSRYGYHRATGRILVVMEISLSWLHQGQYPGCDNTAWKDATTGGKWVKDTWDLCALFLTSTYESLIISK